MSYPRHQLSRAFKIARRNSGNITLNSTNWANVDIGMDHVLAAQVNDVIFGGLSGLTGNENVGAYFDIVTVVAAAPLNSFGKAGAVETAPGVQGILQWQSFQGQGYLGVGGEYPYTVVAGDIVNGVVTVRLRYATNIATNKTLFADTNHPLAFWAKNLGPVDQN